jgi:SAM-dependent MidA family methyltransferase
MNPFPNNVPPPETTALAHSQRLVNAIAQKITDKGGAIPFADFMNDALYWPGLGYYSAGTHKLGIGGDFTTAPELSPLFSHCLAKQCQQILVSLTNGVILELGAGSGIMAAEILKELNRLSCLPEQYLILELSAELRQRQQATLQAQVPALLARVHWLEQLPQQPLSGVIIANEVVDAMPVHRFCLQAHEVMEFFVGYRNEQFIWQIQPSRHAALRNAITKLPAGLPEGYVSETNLILSQWIQALSGVLATGLILLIDYGFPRAEYYHPQRNSGTLMCHYRHYYHDDPLTLVGLQDITAHVDFTTIAEAAVASGLHVAGYTTQANFLLACGLSELLVEYYDEQDQVRYLKHAQEVKTLILPSEMGELFKAIALTRHLHESLLGFMQDDRGRLG